MIMFLVPIAGCLLTHYKHFDVIHWGSYLSALSPFWMVAFQQPWAPILFVVTLSRMLALPGRYSPLIHTPAGLDLL